MAQLRILTLPDRRLRQKARPVTGAGDHLQGLIHDLFETLYASGGIGLAAPQVDVHHRVIVMDVSKDRDSPRCYVNPRIVSKSGEIASVEGCLSVPGFTAEITRARRVLVHACSAGMEPVEEELSGTAAICLQHEIDHLDGKLFVDHLSPLKRRILLKKLAKAKRMGRPATFPRPAHADPGAARPI